MKIYKKRIIILLCSNMAGSEKYPLSFVGKRTHPLNFSNTRSLSGTYHHIEAAWVICKMALNLHSLSLSTDIWHQWRGQYCFCWSVPYTPKIEEICKMSKLSFFSANSLWPVDQGIIWAAKRISQGALFWDCCKNWSKMQTCSDCPCMMLWQCFQLYRAQLHEKPLLTVLWWLDSVQMHYKWTRRWWWWRRWQWQWL